MIVAWQKGNSICPWCGEKARLRVCVDCLTIFCSFCGEHRCPRCGSAENREQSFIAGAVVLQRDNPKGDPVALYNRATLHDPELASIHSSFMFLPISFCNLVKAEDLRQEMPADAKFKEPPLMRFQQAAVKRLLHKPRGFLVAPTGSGKTYMALGVAARLGLKTIYVTHTSQIAEQVAERVKKLLGVRPSRWWGKYEETDGDFIVTLVQKAIRAKRLPPHGLYEIDECLAGDTRIITEKGEIEIGDFPLTNPRYVLSFDETHKCLCWKRIKRWMKKKPRKLLKITVGKMVIHCTPEHKLYTDKGWKEARNLKPSDYVLCVEGPCEQGRSSTTESATKTSTLQGNKKLEPDTSRKLRLGERSGERKHRFAPVDAGSASPLRYQERGDAINRISRNISMGIQRRMEVPSCVREFVGRYWGHSSETPTSGMPTQEPSPHDSPLITDPPKKNGHTTKHFGLEADSKSNESKTRVGGKSLSRGSPNRCLNSLRFTTSLLERREKRKSISIGCNKFPMKACYGGFSMMGQLVGPKSAEAGAPLLHSTRKASRFRNKKPSKVGSKEEDLRPKSGRRQRRTEGLFTKSGSRLSHHANYFGSSDNSTSPAAWNTKFIRPELVETTTRTEPVFDLEVEESHCYFANGMLVHNCHHLSAPQFLKLMQRSRARYKYGFTATLQRNDAPREVFFDILSDHIVEIPHEVCYDEGILANTVVYPLWTKMGAGIEDAFCDANCPLEKRPQKCGDCDLKKMRLYTFVEEWIDNPERNYLAFRKTMELHEEATLVLTRRIKHAERLASLFYAEGVEATLAHGKMKKVERAKAIAKFKENGGILIATESLLGEGADFPDCDLLVLMCPAKGAIRGRQRAGRVMRYGSSGKAARIIDLVDNGSEFLMKLWWSRKRAYQKVGIAISESSRDGPNYLY